MGVLIEPHPGNGVLKSFTKTWHSKSYPQISPSRPELSAAGKIIFVTGGGTGIGKATAIAFAQAGAKGIAIFGRRAAKLQEAAEEIKQANRDGKTTVTFESVDLSKSSDVKKAFSKAIDTLGGGKVDIFISNAGVAPELAKVAGYSHEELSRGLDLNINGTFYALDTILPNLAHDARVFNISSGTAHVGPMFNGWLYSAVKAATIKMFEYLQAEHPNLRVISVHPGIVKTAMNEQSGVPAQDDADLPANFQVWLASPEADFLKGKYVWVNWDVDELKARAEEIEQSPLLRVVLHGVPM